MKRIELRMNEQEKYDVIKSLVDHNGNKNAAAIKLGCTVRTVNRMIQRYKEQGKSGFVHGNRGRKPAHTFSEATVTDIITLYNNKYYDATFSYACELLAKHDGITISALTKIMYKNYITSPRTTKAVRKRIAQQLRAYVLRMVKFCSAHSQTPSSSVRELPLQASACWRGCVLSSP